MARAPTDLRSLARMQTHTAVRVLTGIMREPRSGPNARVAAAEALLNRGWGKPSQPVTGADGEGSVQIIIRNIIEEIHRDDPKLIEHDNGK